MCMTGSKQGAQGTIRAVFLERQVQPLSGPWPSPPPNQGQLTLPSSGFTKLPNERSGLIFDSHLHLHYLQFRNAGKSSFFK